MVINLGQFIRVEFLWDGEVAVFFLLVVLGNFTHHNHVLLCLIVTGRFPLCVIHVTLYSLLYLCYNRMHPPKGIPDCRDPDVN